MKILLMNSARSWGGTEKWTRMAAETLAEEHEVCLAYRREVIGSRFTVRKYRLPCVSHIDLYTLFRLVQIIRKERIEVIIPTKRKDYLLAGLASRICGITNILRLGIQRRLSIPVLHRLIYHTLSDGIIVNAIKIRKSLLEAPYMDAEKIRVIYNGIDTQTIDRQLPAGIPDKPSGFTVTSMGILTGRKGFDFLMRGFARFIEISGADDARLVIIGSGPEETALRALADKLGIGNHAQLIGFIQNPAPHLAESHVFAMVSKNEGISNALLEGMYLGNAPVSSKAGGTDEVIRDGDNGFLIDYGDVEVLARTLGKLHSDPILRTAVAQRAREQVIRQFSLQRMHEELISFCRQQAATRNRSQ
ncbi:MAG: glycosyltransferase [Chlorobium sp.]|jgi:glycosyltransferase involved in cell wall biosynthesis